MMLRGINFGYVANASGARGFFGEGYPYHRLWSKIGLDFSGATFVSKTTTLNARPGNMPLEADKITPREWKPRCIKVNPFNGSVLNAVGLSGPGAAFLLDQNRWQDLERPFIISFMSVASDPLTRLSELKCFVEMLSARLTFFKAPVALQINFSCPNVGLHLAMLRVEASQAIIIASELDIPLIAKLNPLVPAQMVAQIVENEHCDAIAINNTIPWNDLPPEIDRFKLFNTSGSPLKKYGGGGVSGPAVFPIVLRLLREIVALGVNKPIIAGNGIQSITAARQAFNAGAGMIEIGCVAMVRPWRMQGIIQFANSYSTIPRCFA